MKSKLIVSIILVLSLWLNYTTLAISPSAENTKNLILFKHKVKKKSIETYKIIKEIDLMMNKKSFYSLEDKKKFYNNLIKKIEIVSQKTKKKDLLDILQFIKLKAKHEIEREEFVKKIRKTTIQKASSSNSKNNPYNISKEEAEKVEKEIIKLQKIIDNDISSFIDWLGLKRIYTWDMWVKAEADIEWFFKWNLDLKLNNLVWKEKIQNYDYSFDLVLDYLANYGFMSLWTSIDSKINIIWKDENTFLKFTNTDKFRSLPFLSENYEFLDMLDIIDSWKYIKIEDKNYKKVFDMINKIDYILKNKASLIAYKKIDTNKYELVISKETCDIIRSISHLWYYTADNKKCRDLELNKIRWEMLKKSKIILNIWEKESILSLEINQENQLSFQANIWYDEKYINSMKISIIPQEKEYNGQWIALNYKSKDFLNIWAYINDWYIGKIKLNSNFNLDSKNYVKDWYIDFDMWEKNYMNLELKRSKLSWDINIEIDNDIKLVWNINWRVKNKNKIDYLEFKSKLFAWENFEKEISNLEIISSNSENKFNLNILREDNLKEVISIKYDYNKNRKNWDYKVEFDLEDAKLEIDWEIKNSKLEMKWKLSLEEDEIMNFSTKWSIYDKKYDLNTSYEIDLSQEMIDEIWYQSEEMKISWELKLAYEEKSKWNNYKMDISIIVNDSIKDIISIDFFYDMLNKIPKSLEIKSPENFEVLEERNYWNQNYRIETIEQEIPSNFNEL